MKTKIILTYTGGSIAGRFQLPRVMTLRVEDSLQAETKQMSWNGSCPKVINTAVVAIADVLDKAGYKACAHLLSAGRKAMTTGTQSFTIVMTIDGMACTITAGPVALRQDHGRLLVMAEDMTREFPQSERTFATHASNKGCPDAVATMIERHKEGTITLADDAKPASE